jgi:hypothetical protein
MNRDKTYAATISKLTSPSSATSKSARRTTSQTVFARPLSSSATQPTNCNCFPGVQNEMTKITFLTADMIRMHLSKKNLTPAGIRNISRDVDAWSKQLPTQMLLQNFTDDTPFLVKMSMYQVHLLYMGALMLVYRRISCQFARPVDPGRPLAETGGDILDPAVLHCASRGLFAARCSSRIIRLMMEADGVFRRCWLVM